MYSVKAFENIAIATQWGTCAPYVQVLELVQSWGRSRAGNSLESHGYRAQNSTIIFVSIFVSILR